MQRNRHLPRLLQAIVLAILLLVISLAVAPVAQAEPSSPDSSAGHLVVNYTDNNIGEPPLLNSTQTTVQGTHTPDGRGCRFPFPDLKLAASQQMIAAQLVSTDYTTCTEAVKIGTPASTSTDNSGMDSASQAATARTAPAAGAKTSAKADADSAATLATGSGSAYFAVRWFDVVGLQVTGTRSNVSWAWNGSCVTASSGSGSYYWRSGTGWLRDSYDAYIYKYCSHSTVRTDAVYKNGAFCWPGTVWNYNYDVEVRAWYNGTLGGSVGSTYTTYPFACPTLHWKQYLVRVT
jgi:hypothetical protein